MSALVFLVYAVLSMAKKPIDARGLLSEASISSEVSDVGWTTASVGRTVGRDAMCRRIISKSIFAVPRLGIRRTKIGRLQIIDWTSTGAARAMYLSLDCGRVDAGEPLKLVLVHKHSSQKQEFSSQLSSPIEVEVSITLRETFM